MYNMYNRYYGMQAYPYRTMQNYPYTTYPYTARQAYPYTARQAYARQTYPYTATRPANAYNWQNGYYNYPGQWQCTYVQRNYYV